MRAGVLVALVTAFVLTGCGGGRSAQPPTVPRPAPSVHPKRVHLHRVPPVRHVRGPHHAPVPVLVYHVIGFSPAKTSLEGLYVPPAQLRAQVDWLARTGWHGVTLDQVLAYWRDGVALPRKPIVLTFDDGYPGDWRYALPILHAHHWPGVLNLQIGNLVPRRVREFIHAGWQIASHTFTHPDLTTVDAPQLKREIRTSRTWLQAVFHVRVDVFCYPFGRYDAAVVAAVKRAGYVAAETENPGLASPGNGLFALDRIRIGPSTAVSGLAALLGAG